MLGKTAGGLYWMFRFLERAENTARLIEAGFRIALTRSTDTEAEWRSVVITAAVRPGYDSKYDRYTGAQVVDYLLRDTENASSVRSVIKAARDNARLVRTALTTEVWAAVNETWMTLEALLKRPVRDTDLPGILDTIRQQSALVRGALHGTMLRNDIYYFCRVGTYIERSDNTARIIDVKYYTLLPSPTFVGSRLDNVQWETVLRSVSAYRAYRWLSGNQIQAAGVADFLILDRRMPRSLSFCTAQIVSNLYHLAEAYDGETCTCHTLADSIQSTFKDRTISEIIDSGLHEFIGGIIKKNNALGLQFEADYRFTH